MSLRQTMFAVILVMAASCGGGGGGDQAAIAATPPSSWTLQAFNIDGTTTDTPSGQPDFNQGVSTSWGASWQTAAKSEPLRVRLYLSHDDILDGGTGTPGNEARGDVMFFDQVFATSSPNPAMLACTYGATYRVIGCGADTAHAYGRESTYSEFAGSDVDAWIIARVCSVAEPGHCDTWPVSVHFSD